MNGHILAWAGGEIPKRNKIVKEIVSAHIFCLLVI